MVLAKVTVDEFDRFWSVFSSKGAEHRHRFGSTGSRVLRDTENPNDVWILFDWSKEDFERFVSDPTGRELMAEAGLKGPPEPTFVEAAGELGS